MTDETKANDGFAAFVTQMINDKDFRTDTLMTTVALLIRNIGEIEKRLAALEKAVSKSETDSQKKEQNDQDIQSIQDGIDAGVITDEQAGQLLMIMAKKETKR